MVFRSLTKGVTGMIEANTFIVSDIHLGLKDSRSKALLKFLEENCFYKRLIIAGDLCQEDERISEEQLELLIYLRKNSERVVYVYGNHDKSGALIKALIGIDSMKEYRWELAGRKFCVLHGDRFDKWCFVFDQPLVDRPFNSFIKFLKMLHSPLFNVVRDFHSSHFANKAKKYAWKIAVDVVVCGHIHRAERHLFNYKGRIIEYVNCGCWLDDVCSLVAIDDNGKVESYSITPE